MKRLPWLLGALLSVPASAADSGDLERLMRLLQGDFDNRAQFESQDGELIDHLGLQRRIVDVPALGDHVVYAQINRRADASDIYRQTLMVFELADSGEIIANTWRFREADSFQDILADPARLATLTAGDFGQALPASCAQTWSVDGDGFVGRVDRESCEIISRRTGNPRRIQSTEFVHRDAIENEESGYRPDGSMIFGLPEGVYYRYERVADTSCADPVYMVVSGPTLDGRRMGAYAAKLAETGIYAEVGGYYLNAPRPIEIFEGDVDPRHATLMVRFPCLENARRFWNSRVYQETIKPLRLDPPAGDYTVTVYAESDLPEHMRGGVDAATYTAGFPAALEQVR